MHDVATETVPDGDRSKNVRTTLSNLEEMGMNDLPPSGI
jgi:hypothetical protein